MLSFLKILLLITACPNAGEIVKNGICTCPTDQFVQNGACAGKSVFSLDATQHFS